MTVVEAQGINKAYSLGQRTVPVLRDVSVSIAAAEMVAIVGPSGCGKTTLLNCLSGLDTVDNGKVILDGNELGALSDRKLTRLRGEKVGFVFQAFHLIPVLTCLQNVRMPLELLGTKKEEADTKARAALQAVGILDQADKRPVEMSGGQQQRVAIARALAPGPSVIFADEPTGNLDSATGRDVLDVFHALNRDQGATFVIVTHDPNVANQARRILRMDSGRIAQDTRREGASPPAPSRARSSPASASRGSTPTRATASAPARTARKGTA